MTPKPKNIESLVKSALHMDFLGPRIANFRLFRSTISHFQAIAHVIEFHVKISKCHKSFNIWHIAKIFIILYSRMTAFFIITFFWLRSDQNCRRSNVWEFSAPYVPVLKTISNFYEIFNFWQIAKRFITFYSSMTILFIVKFGLDQMKIMD